MSFPKKIPTILGFILIAAFVALISTVFNVVSDTQTKAFQNIKPKDIRVTNVSDSSFTITWATDDPATGLVQLTNNITVFQSCFDERDIKDKLGKYILHSIKFNNLKPGTAYKYKIL